MRVTFATEPAEPGKNNGKDKDNGRANSRANEDFIAAMPDAVVLLDGAGTPAGMESGCRHGVAWYAHTLGAILTGDVIRSDASLASILADGIKHVTSLHEACDLSHVGSPSATVAMLRRTGDDALEWLVLSDSVIVLDPADADAGEPMVICDDRLDQVGAPYRRHLDALLGGSPDHAQARREYIETLRGLRNRDGGFWVASVDPHAAEHALTGSVPAGGVRAGAVLSDGASRLVDLFRLASWRQLLNTLHHHGPAELIRRVRQVEHADPEGRRWPRAKTQDDATAAYWLLTG